MEWNGRQCRVNLVLKRGTSAGSHKPQLMPAFEGNWEVPRGVRLIANVDKPTRVGKGKDARIFARRTKALCIAAMICGSRP